MRRIGIATVGVMGSSEDEHDALAAPLGALLARLEVNLLTGAGRGVMTSVSRAYLNARVGSGITIGVVPCESLDQREIPRQGSPNPFVELPIYTHLPVSGVDGQSDLSRNHINILSSDAIVALPGSEGTASEVELAVRYRKPIVILTSDEVLVQHFNSSVDRLFEPAAVETFIRGHIGAA